MDWLESKGLIDKDINGYTLVKSDYPTSDVLKDGKLIITYWYDDEMSEGGWTEVAIPKTGQEYPKLSYLAGILCFIITILIMGVSYNSIKRGKKQ